MGPSSSKGDRHGAGEAAADDRVKPVSGGLPRVATIRDYADRDAIGRFVKAAIDADPDVAAMLRCGDPSRLVVVKPNWIQQAHEYQPTVWEPVITHPQVVLAVVETLASYMGGRGTICLCDAPHAYADFNAILARGDLRGGVAALRARWPALQLEVQDLRRESWRRQDQVVVERKPNAEDPRGYVRLDLGRRSLFYGHGGEGAYFGADYDTSVVNRHHQGLVQEYLLAGSPMACDLFVNVPKLKTHKKTGITCALKNLVGINGDKNWLPHHTLGDPGRGGDEFPASTLRTLAEGRLKRWGQRAAIASPAVGTWAYRWTRRGGLRLLGGSDRVVRNGNWSGNDTCWRMALDLNRCLLYGSCDGSWRESDAPKRYLAIVDGIVGGQGDGPLCPRAASAGVLAAGTSPAVLDAVAAKLMGFAPASLPIVANAFEPHRWPLADRPLAAIEVDDVRIGRQVPLAALAPALAGGFAPHFGWEVLRAA